MSYTIQYLQSEMAAQGLEVIVLVNCLVQDAIHRYVAHLMQVFTCVLGSPANVQFANHGDV